MSKVRIVHRREECIGCGACVAVCPQYWEMKGDKSHLKGSKKKGENEILEIDEVGCNKDAANSCPVECIEVHGE